VTRLIRVWAREDPFPGAEIAHVTLSDCRLSAKGTAVGVNPVPYRLEYALKTADGFVTSRLRVRTEGNGWRRELDLRRSSDGDWSWETRSKGGPELPLPGGEPTIIAEALDCDLGLSPLTNSMPVRRHALHEGGGPVDFLMAWVSVPDLAVHRSRQRYTFLRREADARIVRYESRGGSFTSDLRFDRDGIVIDYPQLARRIG
jgi:uncharacterized protein